METGQDSESSQSIPFLRRGPDAMILLNTLAESMMNRFYRFLLLSLGSLVCLVGTTFASDDEVVRVFIFAGQSNMVGSDSKVEDIERFPPFAGLDAPQQDVRFSYCIGRENKTRSDGWTELQPVKGIVGPELSFARSVTQNTSAPIAIIKIAAGGTHLGGDWNPRDPSGFEMYPLALSWVRDALSDLQRQGIRYRLEGFMWHQGENDMFDDNYRANYGKNLQQFVKHWRRDLDAPDLRFYLGELCTKTIWGMDLRPRMHEISVGQKQVAANDPNVEYVPTSHVGVEIGGGVGLHYHYGTLGQLEHGDNYASAYLKHIRKQPVKSRPLGEWPYQSGARLKLFVLAGHRNMEGERAFVQELARMPLGKELLRDDPHVAYKYNLGGGYKKSVGWEPMGPCGYYDTFGPELSFSRVLRDNGTEDFAIAKFTHSGSQIIDWTPEGSVAETRNLYPSFITFIKDSIDDLTARGHEVELAGIFYHVGENDMSWGPFRKGATDRVMSMIGQSRVDLELPELTWYVSQQTPTDAEQVNHIDVSNQLATALASDQHVIHVKAFDPPVQEKQLVLDSKGIVWLGDRLANEYLKR
ncbi:MAG: sialate O-acetylesterase [Rubripirellula sp.]